MAVPLMTVISASEKDTQNLAAVLARQCAVGDVILLAGDLGTGKTAFARGFIRALVDDSGEIVSPTFTLVQTYPTRQGWPIWHFDLYRLRDESELPGLGLEEAILSGISLIEWPEIAAKRLPSQALTIQLAYGDTGDERRVTLTGDAGTWRARLELLVKEHREAHDARIA